MANRFCCGFDWPGAATADLDKIFNSVSGQYTIDSGTGRFGNSLRNAPVGPGETISLYPGFTHQTWVVGWAFKITAMPTTYRALVGFWDSGTAQCYVRVTTGGQFQFVGPGGVLATSANAILMDVWYYAEVKVTIGGAGVGNYELRINGSSVGWIPSAVGDTKTTGNTSANGIYWQALPYSAAYSYWDDIYICDGVDGTATQGATNADFKGDCRVDCYAPSGNGSNSGWTGSDADQVDNFELVNDGSEATYVDATGAMIDSYAMADIPAGVIPLMTQVNMRALKTDVAGCVLRPYVLSVGDVATGASINPGLTSVIYHEVMDLDPDTLAAWTRSTLNAAEFGIERVS